MPCCRIVISRQLAVQRGLLLLLCADRAVLSSLLPSMVGADVMCVAAEGSSILDESVDLAAGFGGVGVPACASGPLLRDVVVCLHSL